jgi:peptidylprolyl isomerase
MQRVSIGDKVQILCASRLDDGTVLDHEEDLDRPVWLLAGKQNKLQMVSDALIGMHVGEQKSVSIPPEKGFGRHNPNLVFKVPSSSLPKEIKEGDMIELTSRNQNIQAVIETVDNGYVIANGNHPYVDHTIIVDIEVLAIRKP